MEKRACGWQVKLSVPMLALAMPERLRDEQPMIKALYK